MGPFTDHSRETAETTELGNTLDHEISFALIIESLRDRRRKFPAEQNCALSTGQNRIRRRAFLTPSGKASYEFTGFPANPVSGQHPRQSTPARNFDNATQHPALVVKETGRHGQLSGQKYLWAIYRPRTLPRYRVRNEVSVQF